jgi:hypothetical protein
MVRVRRYPSGQPLRALGVSLNIEVRIIHRVIFIPSGGYIPKGTGIDKLSAPEGSLENLTIAPASVDTPGTKSAARHHTCGTVCRSGGVITVWSLQIHIILSIKEK